MIWIHAILDVMPHANAFGAPLTSGIAVELRTLSASCLVPLTLALPQNLWVEKRGAGSAPARQEGRSEFTPTKGSFPGLDFRCDKRRPPNVSNLAEKPGGRRPIGVSLSHRFCGGGLTLVEPMSKYTPNRPHELQSSAQTVSPAHFIGSGKMRYSEGP